MSSSITQPVIKSSLINLGADRALEIVSIALEKTFPVPQSEPNEQIDSLLRALVRLESR